ncbi:hypothetical protein ACIGCI_11520 [Staphylococcus capitis]|uniref:hypothetical protein n=1 Tax=Staphylococcus capitis TaxID=29388 RepID=UPI00138AEDAF
MPLVIGYILGAIFGAIYGLTIRLATWIFVNSVVFIRKVSQRLEDALLHLIRQIIKEIKNTNGSRK